MTWAIPLSNFINLVSDFINQILRFTHNLITDMGLDLKSPKVIAGFGCSFLTTCIFVLLFTVSLNYLWSPLKAELPQSTNSVDITNETKIVNSLVLANISEDTPNENLNEKALVRSRSNSQIENDDSDLVLPYGNRMRLNFLPDTHDLRVYDDADEFNSLETFHHPFKKDVPPQNDQEATRALHMALQMKHIGKDEKAKKLFQHALALNPYHPDVLNHYGEFLEEHNKDVINANRFYTRALVLAPLHNKALQNRERTLPVVEDLDEKQLSRIDNKRDYLIQIPDNDSSLKRVKKEAYFQHIYHTVAIEGNTMTLAETRMVVETRMAVPGKSIMEHNEIIGLESALKYINSTLVSKVGRLLVSDILQIHKRVLGHVDPLEAGSFRTSQVYVGEHTPPPASDVQGLMEEFVDWINSEDAFNLHPVKFAAIAHYKLVNIHPFIDGNGRSARLLMNLLLMRNGYPPVIIRKQDRSLYYEFLQMANEGDIRPFIRFIAKCTERTLDVYLYATEYGNSVTGMRALGGQDSENHDLEHQVKIIEV